MRHLSLICLVLCALCAWCEDEKPQLPSSAQRLADSFDRDVEKLQASFDKDKAKLITALVKGLEKELDAVTKKGDLEGALAIKARIDELAPAEIPTALKPAVVAKTPPVVGTWTRSGREWKFHESGAFEDIFPSGNAISGQWVLDEGNIVVTMSNGWKVTFTASDCDRREVSFTTFNPAGGSSPGTMVRVK